MGITAINARGTAVFGGQRENGSAAKAGEPAKTGRFDTFSVSGVEKRYDDAHKALDNEQTQLVRALSLSGEEQKALAAVDAYFGMQSNLQGRIRSLEGDIEYFNSLRAERDFCQKTLDNGGKAVQSGEYSFGRAEAGSQMDEDFLRASIARLDKGISLTVRKYLPEEQSELNKRIQNSETKMLDRMADIFREATGGEAVGGSFGEYDCFKREIDGITESNFVGRLTEQINGIKGVSDSLQKSFFNYLDTNKTAEKVFKKYPAVVEMRKQFAERYEKFHELEKQIKADLGIELLFGETEKQRAAGKGI